jgi:subfamily B ATP-binding cassette protein HlyB/CyaB
MIDAFVTIYSLFVLFFIDWKVTLIVLAVLAFVVLWFKIITPFIRENEKRRFLEKSGLFSTLFENIDGLQVIKSFRMEGLFMQRLAPKISNILQIQKKVKYVSLVNSTVIDLLMIFASLFILIFLALDAINHHNISIGQIITYIALSYQIFSSIGNLLDENLDLQENEIILNRYFDFGKIQEENSESRLQLNRISDFDIDKIEFRNIAFHYMPQKPVFSNLNFEIRKGDKIKLEGGNGTGKSTFCKLLSLLYLPDNGDILINNEKQFFYNVPSLRKKILLVSNEDILFNDSIGFNITFDHHADIAGVLNLAREVGLYDFIVDKEDGLEFIVNEQGRNLSTGQRKKVLMMRALFSSADVLILDETFSGIDKESMEKIENYINNQTDRAFIIVSHEPLNCLNFSKTLKMQDGRIEQLCYQRF